MKSLIPVIAVILAVNSAAAQEPPTQTKRFSVGSASNQPVTFRVDTRGSWVSVSLSAGIMVRHEADARIVHITTPAVFEVGGTGPLEISLIAVDGKRLELTPIPNRDAEDRAVFIRGDTIMLRRSADRSSIEVTKSGETIRRGR